MIARRDIGREIGIVLLITFGMSGVRSALRLIDALLSPTPLSAQSTTLNAAQAQVAWLDVALQLCSAGVLCGWGLLVLFLLGSSPGRLARADWLRGLGLAALIGIPGLLFYLGSVQLGLSKQVVPSTLEGWWEAPVLLVWSFANAFAEEVVVVFWLLIRLRQLGVGTWKAIAASAVLRGSYHLYQGVSAGLGNVVMGIVFAWFFSRTKRVWPLVIAHFLIDAVAFVGYAVFGQRLGGLLGYS